LKNSMDKKSFLKNLDYLICLLLITATLAVYWQVLDHSFVNYDDTLYVTKNPYVQAGLTSRGITWSLTATRAGNWHPLTWLSHMLDWHLYGMDPGWHHFSSLLFHTANALLLFLVLNRMTGGLWRSAFVAGLFALHPLHVESVAWVAERKDVLSTFFLFLTLLSYIWYVERPGFYRYFLVILCFVLGLMAKPMVVTLPFLLLLLDFWPLERFTLGPSNNNQTATHRPPINAKKPWRQALALLMEKTPLFILTAVSSFVTFTVQKSGGSVAPLEIYPFKMRLANALLSYVRYIIKMIWPEHLAVFYPHPGQSLAMWQAALAGLLLVVISIAVIRARHRYPYLPVGWFWYVGTLVPVIGLVQVGAQAMADRYTYVPLIGLFIMISWGVPNLLLKLRFQYFVSATAVGIVIAALMICTHLQVASWRNNITLFKKAVEVNANNYLAHINLGGALAEQGNIEEAEKHFSRALQLNPRSAVAHNDLGNILQQQGKLEKAIDHFYESLHRDPNLSETHFNLGNALLRQGKIEEARIHFATALQIRPDFAEGYNSLGVALARQGKVDEAIVHFREAVRLKPSYAQARSNLELALQEAGKSN